MRTLICFATLAFALTALTGCYRMPTDDDCSLVPVTNNPDITRDRGNGMAPSMSY